MGEDVAEEPWLPRPCFARTAMTKCTLRLSVLATKDPAQPFGGAKGEKQVNSMPVTSLVAGIFALLIVPLSVQVSLRRVKANAVFGDAGDETLRKRIRAHGNFVEYAPLAVIALGLAEYRGGPTWLVWSLAVGFGFSRLVHVIGMLFTATPRVRATAMLVNHVSFLAAGIWLVSSV